MTTKYWGSGVNSTVLFSALFSLLINWYTHSTSNQLTLIHLCQRLCIFLSCYCVKNFAIISHLIFSLLIYFQAQKRWNTRPGNGMKNASPAVCAKILLERNLSYRKNRKFTAPVVMKKNMRPDASNVTKYDALSLDCCCSCFENVLVALKK